LARRNATHCFIGGPKRRKQPERYAPFFEFFLKNIDKKIKRMYSYGEGDNI
jgi:hypothetical protein